MREELKKYNEYKFELKILKRKLRQENEEEVKISGSNFEVNGDIRPQGYMSNNIEKQIINKADKVKELEEKIIDLEERINIIDTALNTLKNNDRLAIEMYFFRGLSQEAVASTLGLVDGKKAQQKISNAIIQMDKIFKKYTTR